MTKHDIVPISVLIPTMNRPQTLRRTLNNYMCGSCLPTQIIVVDQSQEESLICEVRKIVELFSEQCNVIYLYQRIPSSTMARNRALLQATEELVIFSDDDIDVYPDTLANVCSVMIDDSVTMVAGIDDNALPSSTNIGYFLGTKSFKNRKIGHVTLSMLGRYPDSVVNDTETQWAMGYFFVIRRSLLVSWDIHWDEMLTGYAYAEDLDFSFAYYKKTKEAGKRCLLSNKVHVKHLVSKEYRVPSQQSTYMYVYNRIYLSYKHCMGFHSRLLIWWCNLWRLIERMIKRERPSDLFWAMWLSQVNRASLKKGEMNEKLFR